MKKVLALFVCSVLVFSMCVSCSDVKKSSKRTALKESSEGALDSGDESDSESALDNDAESDSESVSDIDIKPDEAQVLAICQLATLKCYYHNVATATKSAGTGVSHWGEKDTEFWFEYTASAELGVDLSQVSMTIDGDTIIIQMPDAEILNGIHVDSSSTGDPVSQPNALLRNDVEITAKDVSESMKDANAEIQKRIEDDPVLLVTANRRAQDLIKNYIDQINAMSGKEYKVVFKPVVKADVEEE